MSTEPNASAALDELMDTLDGVLGQTDAGGAAETEPGGAAAGATGDAIDAVLSSPPRATRVRSLRQSPEAEAFRQAVVDGLIRVDTANRLLQLVNSVVVRLLAK